MTTEAALKAWDTRRRNGWVHPATLAAQEAEAKVERRRAARVAKKKAKAKAEKRH